MDWSSSFWIVALSASVLLSLAALMAFSFMVLRISTVELTAPSATFSILAPFWVFWSAWLSARMRACIRSEMAYPELSSAAEFTFMPVATCCKSFASAAEFAFRTFSVFTADMLFFTTIAIVDTSSLVGSRWLPSQILHNSLCPTVPVRLKAHALIAHKGRWKSPALVWHIYLFYIS